ncbi:transporter [Flavicella sediminum]|uniref:transporter n=1 Tax=Flavicella sediminum TaxID=2585141 RepID=UPI00111FA6E5|nr:transporter [Flavicella sediminum]
MTKNYWFLLFLLCYTFGQAQYTDVINSNRPGLSESPFAVGIGVTQLEAGFVHQYIKDRSAPNSIEENYFTQTLRRSFFSEKLEFSLSASQNTFRNNLSTNRYKGFISSYGFGVKYLIYQPKIEKQPKEIRSWYRKHKFDWKRLIPTVGFKIGGTFYNGPNLIPYPSQSIYQQREGSDYGTNFTLLLQNDLNDFWVVTSNLFYAKIPDHRDQFDFIVSSNYTLSEAWAVFGEIEKPLNASIFTGNFRTGLAYLQNDNFQLDFHLNSGLTNTETLIGFGVGASYRIDRHRNMYRIVDVDEYGNQIIPPKKPSFAKRAAKGTGNFLTLAGEKIKIHVTLAAIATGSFFKNIFKKKKNKTTKKEKKVKTKKIKKPKKGKRLQQEIEDRDKPKKEKDTLQDNSEKKSFFSKILGKKNKSKENDIEEEDDDEEDTSVKAVDPTSDKSSNKEETVDKPKAKKKSFFLRLFKKKEKPTIEATEPEEDSSQN